MTSERLLDLYVDEVCGCFSDQTCGEGGLSEEGVKYKTELLRYLAKADRLQEENERLRVENGEMANVLNALHPEEWWMSWEDDSGMIFGIEWDESRLGEPPHGINKKITEILNKRLARAIEEKGDDHK